jgi:hypothetical protein
VVVLVMSSASPPLPAYGSTEGSSTVAGAKSTDGSGRKQTHAAYEPVPLDRLVRQPGTSAHGEVVVVGSDGTASWENPSQCCQPTLAACFYLPFPFFCMGCWMIRRASLGFDDHTESVTVRTWTGQCAQAARGQGHAGRGSLCVCARARACVCVRS